MPRTSASDSEMKSIFVVVLTPYFTPGSRSFSPTLGLLSTAACERPGEVEAVLAEHPDGHDRRGGDEQDGLDDLDPGRATHAADEDVGDHHDADDGDDEVLRALTLDAEQERDEATGAGHLGEQVEERHGEHRGRGRDAHRALLEAVGQHVGHRQPAGVAHELGDEQERDEPRDEEADRVEEAVVALEGDGAGDAEEATPPRGSHRRWRHRSGDRRSHRWRCRTRRRSSCRSPP